ncbi:MAG: cobalamin biosynthesis protein CbiX [Actinomycetota bacterium]|nr:cobalamin biosynthesis protein CbiX [Actinomycetota bacterium]
MVARIAAAARASLPGQQVAVAHLDFTDPSVGVALTELAAAGARDVVVVPLLFAPGYHLRVDLPAAVAEVRAGLPWLSVTIAEPLGAARSDGEPDLLLDALQARLAEQSGQSGRYDAVVLASAGSSDPLARQAIEAVAGRWADGLGRPVIPAYATAAQPTVAEAIGRLRDQGFARVAVSGLFIAPGRLPEAVRRSATEAGAVVVAEPLGADARLVRLLARRANRARAHSLTR